MPMSRTGLAFLLLAAAAPLHGQARRSLATGEPESQLLGYYAAVMQFTPVGLPARDGRLEIGGALTHIPSIGIADRTVGFGGTKTETTNFCSVYPRLTASKGFGAMRVEAGFTPAMTVCGVKASVIALGIGRRFVLGRTWDGYARLSGMSGHVDASATCSPDAVANPADRTCYGGTPSSDRVAPFSVALDFAAGWQGWAARRMEPYVLAGIRHERIDFDVNYTRTQAQGNAVILPPLDDHNRLRTTLTRVHLATGISWAPVNILRLGAELYYAPGAVMTLRGRGALAL